MFPDCSQELKAFALKCGLLYLATGARSMPRRMIAGLVPLSAFRWGPSCSMLPSSKGPQWIASCGTHTAFLEAPQHYAIAICNPSHSAKTSLQAIDNFKPAHRQVEKPLRLPVADAQRAGKAGLVVGGKMEAGAVKPGTRVLIMPSRQEATVK